MKMLAQRKSSTAKLTIICVYTLPVYQLFVLILNVIIGPKEFVALMEKMRSIVSFANVISQTCSVVAKGGVVDNWTLSAL